MGPYIEAMSNGESKRIPSISEYALLGKSGLRVSPLCLGTMTFGTDWGWGAPKETAFRIVDRYLEAGGNFIDTADGYTSGTSESILGEYFAETKRRDEVVLATKFTFSARAGDPNAGGNGRKNILQALDGSLRRLRTDYIDLYWLHAWDCLTPVEEVMSTLDALVRSGKVRHIGFSDVPAWYLARAQTLAELGGLERVIALQSEYSLVERSIEREHVPAALALGVGICSWSPLASGFLTGKYTREGVAARGDGRLVAFQAAGHPAVEHLFTERSWSILDELTGVARELGKTPAEVALAWIARRPGVASTLVGATKLEQLDSNLRALALEIPDALSAKLEAISRPAPAHPYTFFQPAMQGMIRGGATIRAEQPWFRPRA